MGVNLDKPQCWKEDIARSVDLYNQWFLEFAPKTFQEERKNAIQQVKAMLSWTDNFRNFTINNLKEHPEILSALRMCTAPPIARDRLIGLAGVSRTLVNRMEKEGSLPPRMKKSDINKDLQNIISVITQMLDRDIFTWVDKQRQPSAQEIYRAATIVADRLCGTNADPIIRNAQERRQLAKIKNWLEDRGYKDMSGNISFGHLKTGMFAFRINVLGLKDDGSQINIPIDVIVMPHNAQESELPIMIEAKSAGDFTNVNKRRKEEAMKFIQLRNKYGDNIKYILFLCGYFDSGYLGYIAAEGIDWIWEHRIDDLKKLGL